MKFYQVNTAEYGTVEVPAKVYDQLRRSVQRGAKFLDAHAGKWFDRIRTTKLEMSNSCHCIYGQLDKVDLLAEVSRGNMKVRGIEPWDDEAWSKLGYTFPGDGAFAEWRDNEARWSEANDVGFAVLQEEWLREIADRRGTLKAAA